MKNTNDVRAGSMGIPFLCVILLLITFPASLNAWNHSEIKWKTIKTDHFEVHYHSGEEWSAEQAAVIAEQVYGPVTDFYGYEPGGKVHIIISDKEDKSEGAAFYYLNRIDISATDLDFFLRGTARWLKNVITHEFTHIVSIQRAMKMPMIVPSIYLQVVSFEREKRPDVITGYPNFQASMPVAGEVVPGWFAEGLAQYQCGLARNDIWDSHRDMILRVATLNDALLSIDEMGVFGKNSLRSEMVYNQGFSMVRFISERYGYDKLVELVYALSRFYRWTFDGACKKVLDISEKELYRMWKEELEERYGKFAAEVKEKKREGCRVAGRGFFNHFPVHLGTDGRIVYISNCGGDYSDLRLVCEYPGGRVEEIAEDVTSRFSLSPDGKRLCYSKRTKKNKYGYSLNDLFVYDFVSGNEKRLTRSLRATDPAWSPDGKSVACVFNKDGSDRIVILNVDGKGKRYVTSLVPGRQYFGLSWGKKGILASKFDGSSRDIELVDPESGTERVLISSPADERDPCWDEEGAGFLYSSDRTGIFNIYYRSLVDSLDLMVTHGLGGTFGPSPAGSSCLFSYYGPDGFEIREIPDWRNGACKSNGERDDPGLMNRRIDFIAGDAPMSVKQDAGHKEVAVGKEKRRKMALDGEKFGVKYTPIYVFPRLLIYERKARIGIFLDSRDLIDRQSVFAGGSINDDKEFDLNLGFELRQFKPTFSFEVYRSRKYYTNTIYIDGIGDIDFKTRYDLWDAFFTCRMELVPNTPFRRKEIALQYNHGEYGLNIEAWDPFNQELGWNYYKANEISIVFHYRKVRKEVDGDINPRRGRTLDVQVTRAYNKLSSGDFEYAFLPIYDKNHFGRYTLAYEEFVPIPFWSHAMSLRIQGGALDSSEIDDFFYLYLGSRDGLRGYSYYSLGGRKVAMARLTYRFPLLRRINRQIFHIYLSSIYAGLFAEAGKAWNEDGFDFQGNKKDVGFELRVKGFSFYNFPLAASMEAAYGLDDVKYTDPFNKMLTFYEGNKWKFYGSVLFNF